MEVLKICFIENGVQLYRVEACTRHRKRQFLKEMIYIQRARLHVQVIGRWFLYLNVPIL